MSFSIKFQDKVLAKIPLYMFLMILFIRLLSIFIMGPMPQDAYYFFYSQHPALSYFDHPPAIAYWLWLFTSVFGKNIIAIKFADSFLTALTCVAFYHLTRRFFPKLETQKIIILFLSTLLVSILSLVSTPDTPLLFFWTMALIALFEALFNNRKGFWVIAGIFMGLAFDSKYTAVFLPFGLLLFLLFSASKRKYLITLWPWLCILTMVLVTTPVFIWNWNNHFASFAFQSSNRLSDASTMQFHGKFIPGVLGHQLALLIPVLFISVLYAVYRIIKIYHRSKHRLSTEYTFLLCFFLPVFLVFLTISPVYWVKINWMMPAYITGIMLAGRFINQKWLNIQVVISFIVHLALVIEIIFYPVPIKSDDTWVGWKALATQVDNLKEEYRAGFVFSADSYKTASVLNLYSEKFIYGQNVIGQQALQYDFIGTDLSKLNGMDAIYIDSDPGLKAHGGNEVKPSVILKFFNSVKQLNPILIKRNGLTVRKFYVYLCRGYKFSSKTPATELLQN